MRIEVWVTVLSVALMLAAADARRRFVARSGKRQRYRDHFFGAAEELVADDTVPYVVARFTVGLGEVLVSRWLLRKLFVHLLFGRLVSLDKIGSLSEALRSMTSQQQELFTSAFAAFIMALSYNNSILGWILRKLILMSGQNPRPTLEDNRMQVVAAEAARSGACAA